MNNLDNLRIAKLVSLSDPNREGAMKIRFIDSSHDSKPSTAYYTTPSYSTPDMGEKFKFTGLTSFPGEGAFIVVGWSMVDMKWYYMTTLTGASEHAKKLEGSNPIAGGPEGKYNTTFPTAETNHPEDSTYSHSTKPQKHTLESELGGKFQISDSHHKKDLQYYTKMESMTKKRVIADDVYDYIAVQNEHGDGLKITSNKYNEKGISGPAPGPRDAQLRTNGNVHVESDSGSLNTTVLGGYQLNIKNESVNHPFVRPLFFDSKVGELNIESYSNSVNIISHGKEYTYGGSVPSAGKGVFIDASKYQGVVQIRAGKGGVEIWSNGDIDFNCAGNFNVNAVGSINLKAGSPKASTYWTSQNSLPWNQATTPVPPTQGIPVLPGTVNLNPPVDPGTKTSPTLNNDEQWPLN